MKHKKYDPRTIGTDVHQDDAVKHKKYDPRTIYTKIENPKNEDHSTILLLRPFDGPSFLITQNTIKLILIIVTERVLIHYMQS